MVDIPSQTPGEWGKREYEVQILVPNKHRKGERWRPLGQPYGDLNKAEWAIEDLVSSLASDIMPAHVVITWLRTHVRVMEKNITCTYGKQIALPIS